jgi:lipoprotein-anchoring transpeptidase ErfK/SrfK
MSPFRSFAFALFAVGGLSACVTDPGAEIAAAAAFAPGPFVTNAAAYAAVADAGLTIPAVPIEQVPADFQRQTVAFETNEAPGTIIINPAAKQLYFITGRNKAIRYGIAVGRAGFQWSGEALVTDRKTWPTWTPPKEMIDRKPELQRWEAGMPGGLENPLGARALYLTTNGIDYGYRIHGTPEWYSIGKSASSGCIRMINQDVLDLYSRVPDGAKVIVLKADGSMPTGLSLPPKQPAKAKAAAEAPTPARVDVPALTILPPPVFDAPAVQPVSVEVTPQATEITPAAAESSSCLVKNADGSCLCTVPLVDGVCPI